jgi:hypothetical protein
MTKKLFLFSLLFLADAINATEIDGEKIWDIQARICLTQPLIESKTDTLSSTIDAIENIIISLSEVEDTLCSKLAELETCIVITQEDIGTTGFTISTSGKYCLAESIVFAADNQSDTPISIETDNVTLDLAGNTINCNNTCDVGIGVVSATNIVIKNGSIVNSDMSNMFIESNSACVNVENLKLLSSTLNGLSIDLSNEITITNCLASDNGSDGFTVELGNNICFIKCESSANIGDGFSIIDPNTGQTSNNVIYFDCKSSENTGNGFSTTALDALRINNTTICRCFAVENQTNGFIVTTSDDTTLQSNNAFGNISTGFAAAANTKTFNNLAKGNGTNYSGVTDPIETVPDTTTGFWANIAV